MVGGICNDESHVIRTQAECNTALKEVSYESSGYYWNGNTNGWIPSGCSVRNGGDYRPHLDTNTGLGNGRCDLIPICKGPKNSGN